MLENYSFFTENVTILSDFIFYSAAKLLFLERLTKNLDLEKTVSNWTGDFSASSFKT